MGARSSWPETPVLTLRSISQVVGIVGVASSDFGSVGTGLRLVHEALPVSKVAT